MPPGSEGKYFIARLRGGDVAAVGSIPEGAPPMAMWNTYVWVDSADETASKVRDAGGSVADGAVRRHGRRPDGRVRGSRGRGCSASGRRRSTRARRSSTSTGSVNFNGLNTRDVDGAKSFYGSVFGWQTLGARAAASRCGRCPATATTSSATTPTSASGWREVGAPAGFEDVVASINPIPDDQPDVPPHWSVTFAVDDADATAAKASRARRQGDRPAVRCPVGPDDRASATRRARRSSRASSCRRTGTSRPVTTRGARALARCRPCRRARRALPCLRRTA